MLSKIRWWILNRVMSWKEFEDVTHRFPAFRAAEMPRNSKGEIVKDIEYWAAVASVMENRPFVRELDEWIASYESAVRDGVYQGVEAHTITKLESAFRGVRSVRVMIAKANNKYVELTRGRNG